MVHLARQLRSWLGLEHRLLKLDSMPANSPLDLDISDASPARIQALDFDAIVAKANPPIVGWFQFPLNERLQQLQESGEPEDFALVRLVFITVSFVLEAEDPKTPFHPLGIFKNGARTLLPEDFSDSHFDALAAIREVITNHELKARISDVLWQRKRRNVTDAHVAIDEYLECAAAPGLQWHDRMQRMARASKLAISIIGGAPEVFKKVDDAILHDLRASDASYYRQRLLEMLTSMKRTEDERGEFAGLAMDGGRQAMDEGDPLRAHAFYVTASRWFERLGSAEDARNAKLHAAETTIARALSQPQALSRASILNDAVKELREAGAPSERIDEIRRTLNEAQRQSISEMKTIGTTIDVTESVMQARKLAQGLSFEGALRKLAFLFSIPSTKWLRQEAEKLLKMYPLSQGLGGQHLGPGGRVIGKKTTLLGNWDDEDAMRQRMREGSERYWHTASLTLILPFLEQVYDENAPSHQDFLELVLPKPFVPAGRENAFALGLRAGYNGEWYESLHILVPQLENALRHMLESTGELVYGQYSSGVQDFLKLDQVLEHPTMVALLGEDLCFDLTGLLTERMSANLRNKVAHGLVEWTFNDQVHAIYVWWITVMLLFRLERRSGPT